MMQVLRNSHNWVLLFSILLLSPSGSVAQEAASQVLTYAEFLGYVKKYHPAVKQAGLEVSKAEANMMAARGSFDPKLEVDFTQKQFKGTAYYSLLNSAFKIPTWYGIEVKAGFESAEGSYVNPENMLPANGLAAVGISVPLAQGLLINKRMADLRTAKLQLRISKTQRQLEAVAVLYDASVSYFNWLKSYNEAKLYTNFLQFADKRYAAVKQTIALGDKPAVDSIEAGIVMRNRQLSVEEAQLALLKAKLEVANFLWLGNVPVELQDELVPEDGLNGNILQLLAAPVAADDISVADNPKIQLLQGKIAMYTIEQRFKGNLLLPKIDIGYYRLLEMDNFSSSQNTDYKMGFNFAFPLFLRKERGEFNLAKLKVADARLELEI